MTIKLVTIDVDGTLINSQGEVSAHTQEVIKKAIGNGVKIVIASGRPLPGTKKFFDMFGIDNSDDQYAINYNGAMAMTTSGKIIIRETLTLDDYKVIAKFADENGIQHQFETDKNIIVTNPLIPKFAVFEATLTSAQIWYRPMSDLEESLPVAKIMLIDEEGSINDVWNKIPDSFKEKYNIVRSHANFIEFVKKGVSKGNALKHLSEKLNIPIEETMSIGDQGNDLSMIEAAGIGVAMGNAVEEVKQAADFVTSNNDEDGVAKAIEKFVLNN